MRSLHCTNLLRSTTDRLRAALFAALLLLALTLRRTCIVLMYCTCCKYGYCRGGHVGTRVRRAGAEAPARGRVRAGAVTGFVSVAIAMQLTKPNVTAPASRMED